MKKLNAALCAMVLVLASQSSFAKSGGVKSELWNCAGTTKDGYVSNLQVHVDVAAKTSAGFLYDSSMSHEGIEIGADASDLSKLDGAVNGRDQRFYNIELVRMNSESEGLAVVSYNGFIDCIGEVSGVETLSCEVSVEK